MLKMPPIQIKIKSSGADISEYDVPKPTSDNTSKEESKDKVKADIKDPSPDNKKIPDEKDKTSDSINKVEESDTKSEKSDDKTKASEDDHMNSTECYEYEGDDVFYTDQSTKERYRWDKEKESWVSKDGETAVPPSQPSSENYVFDGDTYHYKDESGVKHKWNQTTNQWEKEEESDESEEDDNTTEEQRKARQYRKRKAAPGWNEKKYETDPVSGATIYKDPLDNMVYEWDEGKKAWFPQIGEDFMAAYQLNYGFTNDLESKPTVPEPPKEEVIPSLEEPDKKDAAKQKKVKKDPEPPKWFEEDENKTTKVYVSGLPDTVTEKEFEEIMAKCGMVEHDVRNKKAKLKIYKDEKGIPKGDGLCTYIKHESVELALQIIDGSEYKGKTLSVEPAKFQMKGNAYDPTLKPKKLNRKEKEKAAKHKEKLFAWVPDKIKGERAKNEKSIVIKNLFDPLEFNSDPTQILDYSARIRDQCSKFGTITKLTLYDKHVEGICQIFFKEASEADLAIEMLNGRLFGKRVMNVVQWDGKIKYKKEAAVESVEEETERLSAWEKYLEGEGDEKDAPMENDSNKDSPKKDNEAVKDDKIEEGAEKMEVSEEENTEATNNHDTNSSTNGKEEH